MGEGEVGVDVDREHPAIRLEVDRLEWGHPPERGIVHEHPEVAVAHCVDDRGGGVDGGQVDRQRLGLDAVPGGDLPTGGP
jgi:hypothetical protein